VINGSPMAHGLLIGQDPDEVYARRASWGASVSRLLPATRTFYDWCQRKGIFMGQVVFHFCLCQSLIHCTLTGAKTRGELEQNLRAAITPLPEGIWDELEALGLPRMSDPDPENDLIET
jgi:aryl-alcohol dehydrogenase-like predicted oxidoreductase